jgi:hypothetical protein
LWLAWIEQRQKLRVIRVAGVIYDRVQQVDCGESSAIGELARIAEVECDRVGSILKSVVGEDDIHTRYGGIAEREVSRAVSGKAVQVERCIGEVVGPIVEDHHQPGERGVAGASVVQLNKLGSVGAYLV